MSALRDARFEKALANAPDVDGAPAPAAVRAAIREAAHRAVAKPPGAPWWKALLGGDARMPWNAAFATVLLAGVVTLLWRGGGELPREEPMAERPAPVAAPAPPASIAARPAEGAPPAAPAASHPSPPPAPAAAVAPQRPARSTPAAAAATPAAPKADAQARRDAAQAEKAAVARDEAERREAVAKADTATATRARAAPPPPPPAASRAPIAGFVPQAAAPAPVPAAPAMLARSSDIDARAAAALRATVTAVPAWDTVRIEVGTRAVTIARPQADTLAAALAGLLSSPRESVGAAPARTLAQVTLLQDTRTVGQLWLGDSRATWQPAGEPAITWRPDAALLADLREQVRQLVAR